MWINIPLAVLIVVTACGGLFLPSTYARETRIWAAEAVGGDAVNLLVVAPLLVASAVLTRRGSVAARLVWMGTLTFLVYDFVIYTMAVHFNALFLAYCAVLGLSFYGLMGSIPSLSPSEVTSRYGPRAPVKTMAASLFLVAVVFAALWLGEIIPALLAGEAPKSVADSGLVTSPVHVLDLSIVLPALAVTAFLLLRGRPVAFILAPVLMTLCILIAVTVAGMMLVVTLRGLAPAGGIAACLLATGAGLAVLLSRYLRV